MNRSRSKTPNRCWVLLWLSVLAAGSATAGEPFVVKDIRPGSQSSAPGSLVRFGEAVLFSALEDSTGYELWRTDGTEAGTYLVYDIEPGPRSGLSGSGVQTFPSGVTLDDAFLFRAGSMGRELWRTDGTLAGTYRIVDDYYDSGGAGFYRGPGAFGALDGIALFSASGHRNQGLELWRSDGTEAGTYLVKEIMQQSRSSYPEGFTELNGIAVFAATHVVLGREPYVTDGTEAGTRPLLDIHPLVMRNGGFYAGSSNPDNFTRAGDLVFFAASGPEHGRELWVTDGTPAGTRLVADIRPGSEPALAGPAIMAAGGAGVLFIADDGVHGRELWTSDGSEAGTRLVREIAPGPADGIPVPEPARTSEFALISVDGRAFFAADDRSAGLELWVSDGTAAGTHLVEDLRPGPEGSEPWRLQLEAGRVFFTADDGEHGREPWSSDGSASGTSMLGDLFPGPDWSIGSRSQFVALGDRVVFRAVAPEYGAELWAADMPPLCHGRQATVYVDVDGIVRGGLLDGQGFVGVLHGSHGDDVIVGTDRDDLILAHAGNDLVCGRDGDDRIVGHRGDDLLDGEDGLDSVDGGPGENASLE